MSQFGYQFKEAYFKDLEKDVVLVNHGSYGTTPSMVIDEQVKVTREHENYPDRFELYTGGDEYIEQVKCLADYLQIGELWKSMALVTNATVGINTVLRSYPWNFSKDKILMHSTTYGACAFTVNFLHDYFGLQYEVVNLTYPMEDIDVVQRFEEKLATGEFTMCMFDMITSQPGVTLPYERLITLCNQYHVLSLVDAAHGLGLVDFQFIRDLKPTFLVSNLHKWLSVPKVCAMLYVDPKFHNVIQTIPISWNYDFTPSSPDMLFIEKFARTGTNSYAAFMCIKKAIEFRSKICGGEDAIRDYQILLREQSVPKIIKIWSSNSKNTQGEMPELLENSTKTLSCPGMFGVSYPVDKSKYKLVLEKLSTDPSFYRAIFGKFQKMAVLGEKNYVPFSFHNNKFYVRFSTQVFNEVDDFVAGAIAFKQVFDKIMDVELATLKAASSSSKL